MTSTIDSALADLLQHREVEAFLFHEAELLDERRFEEWLDLLTDDVHYWMPVRSNRLRRDQAREVAAPDELAHFDEDITTLRARVRRIRTGSAWTEEPASRTRRLVSNVRVLPSERDEELIAKSNLLLWHNRGEDENDVFAATRADVVRRGEDGGIRLARRTVLVDQAVILAKSFSFFF